jgi:predicted nucleotidyltransferase
MAARTATLSGVRPEELAGRLGNRPETADIRLLVLHGSRARGDHRPDSDWDFGLVSDGEADLDAVLATLTDVLGTDSVDLVDLRRASALLRYRAARDGVPVLERPVGEFPRFQLEAVQFWCDAGPVIRAAQREVLTGLG